MLPMIYADPELAREVILYSARGAAAGTGQIPYAISELLPPFKFGNSDDLDLWLLLAAAEYGLATRDSGFFDTRVGSTERRRARRCGTHLKLAFRAPAVDARTARRATSPLDDRRLVATCRRRSLQMTESTSSTRRPRISTRALALLATLGATSAFARAAPERRRARDASDRSGPVDRARLVRARLRRRRQIGIGSIFEEPQPWAILAGTRDRPQRSTLVARTSAGFSTGSARRAARRKIGTAQSPARTTRA